MSRKSRSCLVVSIFATSFAVGCGGTANRLPDLPDQEASTDEDVPVDIRVLDGIQDPDSDTLTVTAAVAPGHRIQVIQNAIVRLTPMQDFHGPITVAYTVSDGNDTIRGIVKVTVRPINDAPTAAGGSVNVRKSVPIVLNANDVDGDMLMYEVVDRPQHGMLVGTPPMVEYVPDAGFTGDDRFSFQVSDGMVMSAPATVALHVVANHAPVAVAETFSPLEDLMFSFTLQGTDLDGDPLTFKIEQSPVHGTLNGVPPTVTYVPDKDFFGDDSLQFTVSDGDATSAVATINLQVRNANDPPVATLQTVDIDEDTRVSITLGATDIDGDALTFNVRRPAEHGSVFQIGERVVSYTPNQDFHGTDSFTFDVVDDQGGRDVGTVTINVASVNDAPVANSGAFTMDEDSSGIVTLSGSDADGDPIAFTITSQPQRGTLSVNLPDVRYTPDHDFNGSDSFTYTASDGHATSAEAIVSFQVRAINDPPVAIDASATIDEDTSAVVTLQATDVDSTVLTFSINSAPPDGTFTLTGAVLTYHPAPNANGTRTFKFRVADSNNASSVGTVTITITPLNDPPTVRDDFVATSPGVPLTINVVANDVDPDGDAFHVEFAEDPPHGVVDVVDGNLVYTPDPGFTGTDVFAYTVIDANDSTATAHVHVGVPTYPPDAPSETFGSIGESFGSGTFALTPAISGDGRYIAFTSNAALVPEDTNGVDDVYLYDRGTRTLTRISVASDGSQSNHGSFRPHISADGRYAVFESLASNLVAGDTNDAQDVFRHDRMTGETIRVSVASGGGQARGISGDAELSDDGNRVVFTSFAFDVVPNDANGASDVFVHDIATNTTTRISVSMTSSDGDLASTEPAISGDGRFVAFTSAATNLVPGDTNNLRDVFVRDRVAGTTTRVSVSTNGVESNGASSGPAISGDGRFISFLSTATNLVSGQGSATVNQVYVRDTQAPTTTLPLPSGVAILAARLSGDGQYLILYATSSIVIRDRFTPATRTVSPGALTWFFPVLSANGRYFAVLNTPGSGNILVAPNPL